MKKYPSIEQFRNVIRSVKTNHDYVGTDEQGNNVYQHTENYPTLKFKGTVKLHGTNAGIVNYGDRIEFQSRERVLSLNKDNAGFMNAIHDKDLSFLFERFNISKYCAIYGEWCGGNIQKGVAINGLEKMFVIFGIVVDDNWIELPPDLHKNEIGIYNILQFPTYEVDIDFNSPETVQNDLIRMTLLVEDECPVGKFFNKKGVGEGIVFTCVANQDLKFKSKGEKHSVSKVKTLNAVDTEVLNNIKEFVEMAVSNNRLEQGISFFKENNISSDIKNIKIFLSWIIEDILKEESDTLSASGLCKNKVKAVIANKAKTWYINRL